MIVPVDATDLNSCILDDEINNIIMKNNVNKILYKYNYEQF